MKGNVGMGGLQKEIMNAKSIEHMSRNGTVFKSERGDLRSGVMVVSSWDVGMGEMCADFAEFAAWHALHIHPNLNGFGGYDAISYEFDDK